MRLQSEQADNISSYIENSANLRENIKVNRCYLGALEARA